MSRDMLSRDLPSAGCVGCHMTIAILRDRAAVEQSYYRVVYTRINREYVQLFWVSCLANSRQARQSEQNFQNIWL